MALTRVPDLKGTLMATRTRSNRRERQSAGGTVATVGPRNRAPNSHGRRTSQAMIADLESRIAELRTRIAARKAKQKRATEPKPRGTRFSPKWLASHREKLAISAADYAALVGVSALTVYNWEKGKTKPRAKQLAALARVRALKQREAWKRLDALDGVKL